MLAGPGSERGERADSGNGLASKAESLSVLNSDTDFLLKLVGISFGGKHIGNSSNNSDFFLLNAHRAEKITWSRSYLFSDSFSDVG